MTFLLGTEKVRVEMPAKVVLNDVSIGVETGDRIGIVGLNGDGKSTLLKVLAGEITPDEGRVIVTGNTQIGFLRQTDNLDDSDTVINAIVGDVDEHVWASDRRVRDLLEGLVGDIALDAKIKTLSGGQRRRVDLARVLSHRWDSIFLDEPTNHLDIKTIAWLANYLNNMWKQNDGALVVVSHDRWFLDEVCNRIWEVHDGKIDQYDGGFSAYVMARVERARIARATEQKRQNRLRRELAWLSRGARARATKPKFHVAAARELIADVPELRNTPELRRMAVARIGKDVVELRDVSVDFGDGPVLDRIDWTLGPADRVGIVGANGAGKTTLLNVIRGAIRATAGRVRIGATVKFAMLSQRLETLNEHKDERVRELAGRYSSRKLANGRETSATQLLEDLGFSRGELNEYVRDLSGGQARRLALMMVLLEEVNVLILDEPGNDLDIDMLAALEDLLDDWPGTLVLVTHDRNLMERTTDNQYALIDGKLTHLPGGVDDYFKLLEAYNDISDNRTNVRLANYNSKSDKSLVSAGKTTVLFTNEAKPKQELSNSERQRLRKLVASCEKKIATAEEKLSTLNDELSQLDPTDFEALMNKQSEIDELSAKIDTLTQEWLEASDALGGS